MAARFWSLLAGLGIVVGAHSSAGAAAFKKGPYLQNVSMSTVTVMWEADHSVVCDLRLLSPVKRTIKTESERMHEIVIDKLSAGKRYRYSVTCGNEKAVGEFATAPESGAPFSFVVFGDSRHYESSHLRVVERVRREVPDFILGTGDMVDTGGSESDWQKFFNIEGNLLRENVLFPSLGNHDRQGRGKTADNYRKYFSLPENSPNPERYYAFTYASARFLILDSNAHSFALTDQTAWIKRQLRAARRDKKIKHVFVTMHHPPFSVSLHGGQTELREAWTPLFEEFGVAAVFSGHDHVYSRAYREGVNYFVSGGGGAPLYPHGRRVSKIDKKATKYFERVNHYMRVQVVGDLIEISAIRSDGSTIETVSWGSAPRPEAMYTKKPVSRVTNKQATRVPAAGAGRHAATVRQASPAASSGGGFGLMGMLGGLLMLFAGAGLFWTLRN